MSQILLEEFDFIHGRDWNWNPMYFTYDEGNH